VSDLEPEKFLGDNWPGGFFTTEPTATELSNISSITPLIGQVFAVYVNNGLGATLNLSKQTLTAIFQGQYADWNTVPKADGTGFVSASSVPLKLCNRDVGSGTRAGVLLYFNGYSCNPAAGTFLTTGPKVVTALNNDTGAERTCIKNTVGGIGYAVIQTAANVTANNMTVVSINGVLPTVGNAAAGQYDYWFEATFNSGSALGGNAAVLAGILQTNIGTAANAPAGNVGLVALADYNTPVVGAAIQTANMPIALGTHGGNSCALPNSAL
jgi:ABC-type phosphate transport system substrate-binding protein